jgi:hypothetical protein
MDDKIILNEFNPMMNIMICYVICYFFLMVNLVGIEILQGEEYRSLIMRFKILKMTIVYGYTFSLYLK